MNRTKMFMNRFVFNSKLNKKRFEINHTKIFKNKNKNKIYQMVRVNHYHAATYPPQNDGNKPPNWRLFIIAAIAFYSVNNFKK